MQHIACMTYNVCFGCMADNSTLASRDATGNPLAGKCLEHNGANRCMRAVVDAIDGAGALDFVALQEATSHQQIQQASNTLRPMTCVSSLAAFEEMATFVGPDWDVVTSVDGDIGDYFSAGYNQNAGRAFQIVVCRRGGVCCVFVNAHNGQSRQCNTAHLTNVLSNAVDTIPAADIVGDVVVIVAGDFNDRGRFNFWQGFQPFGGSTVHSQLAGVVVACDRPPMTCCDAGGSDGSFRPHGNGDYIMSDAPFHEPNTAKTVYMASDHLPVTATVDGPIGLNAAMGAIGLNAPPAPTAPPAPIAPIAPPAPPAPPAPIAPPASTAILGVGRTLRLAGDSSDPNGTVAPTQPFKGATLRKGSVIEFPGDTIFQDGGTQFQLVYAKQYPHNIGYVRRDYIDQYNRLAVTRTMRLKPLQSDPNAPGFEYMRGATLRSGTELCYVDGSSVTHNNAELTPVLSGDEIGFVQSKYIVGAQSGGGSSGVAAALAMFALTAAMSILQGVVF